MKPTHMWCRSCYAWTTVRRVREGLECRQCARLLWEKLPAHITKETP